MQRLVWGPFKLGICTSESLVRVAKIPHVRMQGLKFVDNGRISPVSAAPNLTRPAGYIRGGSYPRLIERSRPCLRIPAYIISSEPPSILVPPLPAIATPTCYIVQLRRPARTGHTS
jgi:hypothetical protein